MIWGFHQSWALSHLLLSSTVLFRVENRNVPYCPARLPSGHSPPAVNLADVQLHIRLSCHMAARFLLRQPMIDINRFFDLICDKVRICHTFSVE